MHLECYWHTLALDKRLYLEAYEAFKKIIYIFYILKAGAGDSPASRNLNWSKKARARAGHLTGKQVTGKKTCNGSDTVSATTRKEVSGGELQNKYSLIC